MLKRNPIRQRGTVYLLVLSITTLLVGIGVTAVIVGRINLKTEALEADQTQARFLAQNSIDLLRQELNADPSWRTNYTNDTWYGSYDGGVGTVRFKLIDEGDGSLIDDDKDPVRMYVQATVGGAVRIYSVVLSVSDIELDIPIITGSDDAVEDVSTSRVRITEDTLQLCDALIRGLQYVGLRFASVNIPNGAVITAANIQFKSKFSTNLATDLTIRAQADDNALTFEAVDNNISIRATTSSSAAWSPTEWTAGNSGQAQQSPDLTALAQEVVSRPGWASGNAMGFVIDGTGRRASWSYNGDAAAAPVLHLEYAGTGVLAADFTTLRRELAD